MSNKYINNFAKSFVFRNKQQQQPRFLRRGGYLETNKCVRFFFFNIIWDEISTYYDEKTKV